MLSNTNDIHIEKAFRAWNQTAEQEPAHYFEKVYLSQELGMRKPHPTTFKAVCEREGLNPGRTLFIDDSIQHIEGAKQAGLVTHHLTDISYLASLFS